MDLAGRRVTGQVVDAADRSPIDQATVELQAVATGPLDAGKTLTTASDVDGTFTVTDIAPGTYRITARSDDSTPAEATIEVGDTDVDGVLLTIETGEAILLQRNAPLIRINH